MQRNPRDLLKAKHQIENWETRIQRKLIIILSSRLTLSRSAISTESACLTHSSHHLLMGQRKFQLPSSHTNQHTGTWKYPQPPSTTKPECGQRKCSKSSKEKRIADLKSQRSRKPKLLCKCFEKQSSRSKPSPIFRRRICRKGKVSHREWGYQDSENTHHGPQQSLCQQSYLQHGKV